MLSLKVMSKISAKRSEVGIKKKGAEPIHVKAKKAVSLHNAPEKRGKARNARVYED